MIRTIDTLLRGPNTHISTSWQRQAYCDTKMIIPPVHPPATRTLHMLPRTLNMPAAIFENMSLRAVRSFLSRRLVEALVQAQADCRILIPWVVHAKVYRWVPYQEAEECRR